MTVDPREMTRDQLVAYVNGGGDISELLAGAAHAPLLGPPPQSLPMIVTGVRLPADTVARLDALAGNDRGGRSGLIRDAVDEYLRRHGEAA